MSKYCERSIIDKVPWGFGREIDAILWTMDYWNELLLYGYPKMK